MLYLLIVVLIDRMRLSRWVGSESPTVNPSWAAVSTFHLSSFRNRVKLSPTMLWVPMHSVCCVPSGTVTLKAASLVVGARVQKIRQPEFSPF